MKSETHFLEIDGDARVPDDVESQIADSTDEARLERLESISDVQADYLSIFSSGAYTAEELLFVLKVAELDLAQGVISAADYAAFEKAYEAQASYENYIELVDKKNSSIEIRVILDSALQSHKAGLITDKHMHGIQMRAESRKGLLVYLNRTDDFSDDGRYGKQT